MSSPAYVAALSKLVRDLAAAEQALGRAMDELIRVTPPKKARP